MPPCLQRCWIPTILWSLVLLKILFHWRLCEAHLQVSLLHLVAWLAGMSPGPWEWFIFTLIYIYLRVIKRVIKIHNIRKMRAVWFVLIFPKHVLSEWKYYNSPARWMLPLFYRQEHWAIKISHVFNIQIRPYSIASALRSSSTTAQFCQLHGHPSGSRRRVNWIVTGVTQYIVLGFFVCLFLCRAYLGHLCEVRLYCPLWF